MKRLRLNDTNLADFIAAQTEAGDAFALVDGLVQWLRRGRAKRAAERVRLLRQTLNDRPELCAQTAAMLIHWLCSVRLYPLFISAGIFSRDGFVRELIDRIYEKFNPAYKDPNDLRDLFSRLFTDSHDAEWIEAVPETEWLKLFLLLRRHTTDHDRETAARYLSREGLHAVEMLAVWVAAEELEPNLIRLDKKLLDRDSPFVGLQREVAQWVYARANNNPFDDAHLAVMRDQCFKQVERLRKKGTGAGTGSSMNVAHLLQRLEQTLTRMTRLMAVFGENRIAPRNMLFLTKALAKATAEQTSISRLWKSSVKMLSRSITQNTSDHGEHYITNTRRGYYRILFSAAGGGVLIALMSLFKIHLGTVIQNQFWLGVAEGLNYGIGFALIFMLGFTVATKQPAMTASRFVAVVERNESGKAVNRKLAELLVDVLRSQTAAVVGNVAVALVLAMLIAVSYSLTKGFPLLDAVQVHYQLQAIDPTKATLWYAAIAGFWLFCSGIISGFFDNRCDYLNLRQRLRYHPLARMLLPEKLRGRFADYMHNNYGSLMGNLCFGMLLGLSGFIGHTTGLPFDIRHVAFSSANVGYAAVSGSIGFWAFIQCVIFVMMIGSVNLWVSFMLTLSVALRSRETKIDSWWGIFKCVADIARERPLSLLLPVRLPADEAAAAAETKIKSADKVEKTDKAEPQV